MRARELLPGTLFYLPPRTPHRVLCHRRSLALSLTWARPTRLLPRPGNARPTSAGLAWDVASGWAEGVPRTSRRWLWPQPPLLAAPVDRRRGTFPLATPAGTIRLPARARYGECACLRDYLARQCHGERFLACRREADLVRVRAHRENIGFTSRRCHVL